MKYYALDTARPPDLLFEMKGTPPRRTLQSARGAAVVKGRLRFFTRPAARMEAAEMLAAFARMLPPGWTPREEPCAVEVLLVYPLRATDRADGGELLHHAQKPDLDNLLKSILDNLTRAGTWRDDAQVDTLGVRKRRGAPPRWEVRVWFAEAVEKPRRSKATPPADGQGRLF